MMKQQMNRLMNNVTNAYKEMLPCTCDSMFFIVTLQPMNIPCMSAIDAYPYSMTYGCPCTFH